jgi:excisionase family DNA binding protein
MREELERAGAALDEIGAPPGDTLADRIFGLRDGARIHARKLLSTYEAGAMLQVHPSTLVDWIAEGRIKASRTPGGHKRIRAAELAAFCTREGYDLPEELEHLVE